MAPLTLLPLPPHCEIAIGAEYLLPYGGRRESNVEKYRYMQAGGLFTSRLGGFSVFFEAEPRFGVKVNSRLKLRGNGRNSQHCCATMLGVVESVLAVVCKRMQQLPAMLEPTVHRGKNTTHTSL